MLVKEFIFVGLSCEERWFSYVKGTLLPCYVIKLLVF